MSPNTSGGVARDICRECGIAMTDDLGKYLGVPLIHKRVTKHTYSHIVEKVQARLTGWKANCLSLAGRATLVQAVTSAIPTYTMQATSIPKTTCNAIEKLNRQFLWGDTENKRKVHLINWQSVCEEKACGGLGIKNLKDHNSALLAKVGWNVMKKPEALWVKVVKAKYLKEGSLLDCKPKSSDSYQWKCIKKGIPVLREGLRWRVGKGNLISL